ncbi:MAG TPA: hypothetical protein VK843_09520 [Planctomycetota bacterium]|nr:hypothetical protein [Planctomycetota bacterium]
MNLTTANGIFGGKPQSTLRLLEEMPGIPDVVWSILSRVDRECDPMRLVFISAEARAGNTLMAAATAVALARHLRVPVCLLEANVEHPALASYLGLRATGLTDVLDGRAKLEECVQRLPQCPDLFVLPAGTPRAVISGEFSTAQMRSILGLPGKRVRYLVIDAPPLQGHLESRLLLQHADAALLVLRAGSTRIDSAAHAHRILMEAGAPLLGSVFNAYGAAHATRESGLEAQNDFAAVPLRDPIEPSLVKTDPASDGLRKVDIGRSGAQQALPEGMLSEVEHRREVEMLERRIAKLTQQLEATEADLQRMAAAKGIDLGLASIYRSVQGLSPQEEALALKKDLMQKIFQANLELKQSMEQRSSAVSPSIAI